LSCFADYRKGSCELVLSTVREALADDTEEAATTREVGAVELLIEVTTVYRVESTPLAGVLAAGTVEDTVSITVRVAGLYEETVRERALEVSGQVVTVTFAGVVTEYDTTVTITGFRRSVITITEVVAVVGAVKLAGRAANVEVLGKLRSWSVLVVEHVEGTDKAEWQFAVNGEGHLQEPGVV